VDQEIAVNLRKNGRLRGPVVVKPTVALMKWPQSTSTGQKWAGLFWFWRRWQCLRAVWIGYYWWQSYRRTLL